MAPGLLSREELMAMNALAKARKQLVLDMFQFIHTIGKGCAYEKMAGSSSLPEKQCLPLIGELSPTM